MNALRTRNAIVVLAALVALTAGVAGAQASSGGTSSGGYGSSTATGASDCPNKQLGKRTLALGDCGGDVETLNWILKAKDYGTPALAGDFDSATEGAVEEFQADADLADDGVFDTDTAAALVNAMPPQLATWYGPGFFGNETACGQTLTPTTMGVAHRKLPCGSKVVLNYGKRFVRTTVIDRGPFANGARWDLTQRTAEKLRFEYTDEVRVAKIPAPAPK